MCSIQSWGQMTKKKKLDDLFTTIKGYKEKKRKYDWDEAEESVIEDYLEKHYLDQDFN